MAACYHEGALKYAYATKNAPVGLSQAERDAQINQALKVLEKGCLGGVPEACHNIAHHYLRPPSLQAPATTTPNSSSSSSSSSSNATLCAARDPAKAIPFLIRGCERNHIKSCLNLAVLFKNGEPGIPADPIKHEQYRRRTLELKEMYGGLGGKKKG